MEELPIKLEIDVENLTIGDQMDLEQAQSATVICDWLVAHAGVTLEQLRPLKLKELKTLVEVIGQQLAAGLQPSKPTGTRS